MKYKIWGIYNDGDNSYIVMERRITPENKETIPYGIKFLPPFDDKIKDYYDYFAKMLARHIEVHNGLKEMYIEDVFKKS